MNFSEWILAHGENLQYILFFTLLLLLGAAERWIPRRPGLMDRAIRWPANYFLTAVNIFAMGLLPVSFLSAAIWAESRGWGLLQAVQLPAAVAVAVGIDRRAGALLRLRHGIQSNWSFDGHPRHGRSHC